MTTLRREPSQLTDGEYSKVVGRQEELIPILLVDPQQIVIDGLQLLLSGSEVFRLVGALPCGREVVSTVKKVQARIVVLNDNLPDIAAADIIRKLQLECPDCKVLALSSDSHWTNVIALFRAGAWGFVTKERPFDDLNAGLKTLSLGKRFVDGQTGGLLASTWGEVPGTTVELPLASLSKREHEVFCLLIEGRNAGEIAKLLFISKKTAEKHRRVTLRKLKIRNTAELMRFAVKNRFINP